MLEILKQLVGTTSPKQLGNTLKRNTELKNWLVTSTINESIDMSLSERAYLILNGLNSNKCKNNNVKTFISITQGYRFCGRAANCDCARNSVSEKVTAAKQLTTHLEQLEINQKRARSNIEKYGVENAGQTEAARAKHQEFYNNVESVQSQVSQQKATMIERYGVDNPLKVDSIKQKVVNTTRERYGVDNINQLPERREALKELAIHRTKKVKENNFWFNKLNSKYKNINNVEFRITADEYQGAYEAIWYPFKCLDCNHEFDSWIYSGHIPTCKVCNPTEPSYSSKEENELADYLRLINANIQQSDKSLINPYEIDIIDYDKKIAVEYCGLYWHSEISNNKTSDYHLKKMLRCNEKGYRLLTIFSDEWKFKKDIVKSKLRSIFNLNTSSVGARKCNITEINSSTAQSFYNTYHLQGSVNGKIHIGLVYNNDIVAVMSFGKPRKFIAGIYEKYEWELLRYATSTQIIGGAGKLLKYFENTMSPKTLISYADARWSEGNMYTNVGFNKIDSKLNPGYWYTKDYSQREHRYNFTKNTLVKQGYDKNLTEWEIMQSIGYDRIWDCGQYKFEKIYKK